MKVLYQELNGSAPPPAWIIIKRVVVDRVLRYQMVTPGAEHPGVGGAFRYGKISPRGGRDIVVCEAAVLQPLCWENPPPPYPAEPNTY